MQVALLFDPATEVDLAREALDRLNMDASVIDRPAAGPDTAIITPHAALATIPVAALHQETNPDHRSRKLLEALTSKAETFEDLAPKMRNEDGSLLTKAQMRAVYRNLRRTEGRMISEGALAEPVVQSDFDQYDQDGAGRYFLTGNSYKALNQYLNR